MPRGAPAPTMRATIYRWSFLIGIASFALQLILGWTLGGERIAGAPIAILSLLTLASAIVMLAAAIRAPPTPPIAPREVAEASPSEAFIRLAERAEDWIARARRYLIASGIALGLVWIPLMAFGLFVTARGPDIIWLRGLSLAGLIAFAAATLRWWRRVREVDEELREWRARIERLRGIEKDLLA